MKKYSSCMLVDDEMDLLDVLKANLECLFERIDTCSDGQQAFEQIRSNQYDLIVSDVQMPHMKGDELLRNLRTHGIVTPFICMSGNGNRIQMMETKKQGAVVYMEKPFDFDLFLEEIKIVMESEPGKHRKFRV